MTHQGTAEGMFNQRIQASPALHVPLDRLTSEPKTPTETPHVDPHVSPRRLREAVVIRNMKQKLNFNPWFIMVPNEGIVVEAS